MPYEILLSSIIPVSFHILLDNFSAAVEAKCAEKGVGIVRPSGEGFAVKVAGVL